MNPLKFRSATRYGLLGQRQPESSAAFGSYKILARAVRHVVLHDSLARVVGLEHNGGVRRSGRDRGWSSSKSINRRSINYTKAHASLVAYTR